MKRLEQIQRLDITPVVLQQPKPHAYNQVLYKLPIFQGLYLSQFQKKMHT